MSTAAEPYPDAMSSRLVPVGPSVIVRLVLAPMTKLLNPLVGTLAGRRFLPMMARIHHIGRRTRKLYITPTSAHVAGDTIVVPLSFGNRSDWARNVQAAGQCVVQVGGKRYHAVQPQFIDAIDAKQLVRQSFNAIERLGFRLLGVRQFLLLHTIH
jgi:deazaflavin-dependent oxidoreductase (nitroreductase family)